MVKLRTGDPWMPAPEYSRSLRGFSVNLIVRNIEQALVFQREVLGATVVYADPDFAVVTGFGSEWMLHADHTYQDFPIEAVLRGRQGPRGTGVELRLHGRDPDEAEEAARTLGFEVLVPTVDKGHGLREVVLVDADGYIWVPDVAVGAGKSES